MIARSPISPQYIVNINTGEIGLFVALGPSPYTHERMDGIDRVHVTVFIPSGNGKTFQGSDYWLLDDVEFIADAVQPGTDVTFVTKRGVRQTGTVLSVESNQLCAMLPDGRFGWVFFKYVVSVGSPLAASPLTTSATAIA